MPHLFIADLHLSSARPAVAEDFRRFLADLPSETRSLTILGDLFDYWVGDDALADPFNSGIAQTLATLAERGIRLAVQPGNRDFLLGADFARLARAELLPESCVVDLDGTPTLLLHGDELCTRDQAYQAFRSWVRNPEWRKEFLARPLAERNAQISALRARSEQEKQDKEYDLMDADPAAVETWLTRTGCTRLIHGHVHRPGRHEHIVNGQTCERWVLGTWDDRPEALACDATGCRVVVPDGAP